MVLIIDLDTKSVKGNCKAGEIKKVGLIEASIENKEDE
jgi:hypothetical protein